MTYHVCLSMMFSDRWLSYFQFLFISCFWTSGAGAVNFRTKWRIWIDVFTFTGMTVDALRLGGWLDSHLPPRWILVRVLTFSPLVAFFLLSNLLQHNCRRWPTSHAWQQWTRLLFRTTLLETSAFLSTALLGLFIAERTENIPQWFWLFIGQSWTSRDFAWLSD